MVVALSPELLLLTDIYLLDLRVERKVVACELRPRASLKLRLFVFSLGHLGPIGS